MSSETGGGPPRRNNALLDTAEDVISTVGQLGYGLFSFGLSALPRRTRQHVHTGVHEFHRAIFSLPRDLSTIVVDEVNRWAASEAEEVGPARVQHIKVGVEAPAASAPAPAPSAPAPGKPAPAPSAPAAAPAASSPPPSTLGAAAAPGKPAPAPAAGAAAGVSISHIEFDPPGRDLHGEYVLISNKGAAPVNLMGWTLEDGGAKHSFVFPAFTLVPGAEVKLWTRAGTNDAANLYWGNRTAIWNNEGDTATLKNATGAVVGRYSYEGKKS